MDLPVALVGQWRHEPEWLAALPGSFEPELPLCGALGDENGVDEARRILTAR